ncbi:acyl--CoA ligase [Roseovarius sp. SCSIO 43702]|uniref:class I adenylate-forming enzyme family protein n=1 Tax=Roseovarius sp. SCSIO 43702 TaxID=2823043 RepID=UPI001C733BE9|nr:class I adenylate-forming enzyme family protein [Roseovarius sp. SCSIO 43702]QYX55347.1 acyl--CoA ligase [Roseovarius sp. SCSIO 43702]
MLSVVDTGPPPPCPAPFNMAAHVLIHAESTPERIALAVVGPRGAEEWSHARLAAAVRGTATGLLERGLGPGDRVLLRLGNTVDFPIAYLGCIVVGLVPVPTSPQLTAREVAALLPDLAPAAILRDPAIACPETEAPQIAPDALRAMRELPPAPFAMGDPGRPAYIVYTSGTAARPRAVIHAHRAVWARRMMHEGWCGLGSDDRLLHAGAFNWTYTMGTGLMDPWHVGATALIPEAALPVDALPDLLKRYEATIFAAAPGIYRKILNLGTSLDLPRLRHGLSAGEKLSPRIAADWHAATGTAIYEAYGMSECSTFVSSCPARPAPAESLGWPQPGRRVAILGEDGPVPRGTPGVIAVHRDDPGLMLGYLGCEDPMDGRLRGDWFLTGDQGLMAEDGAITYLARSDDMMNAGGYRVSPLEVEEALAGIPGIDQIAVTEVEVKRDARLIMAFYTGAAPLPEDLLARHAAERLARYKCPRGFFHVEALPTNPNGKLQRRALAQFYEARHGAS